MSTDLLSLWGAIQRGDKHAIASHMFPSPSSSDGQHGRKSASCGAQHELSGEERPHTGPGTAGAGTSAKGDRELGPVVRYWTVKYRHGSSAIWNYTAVIACDPFKATMVV